MTSDNSSVDNRINNIIKGYKSSSNNGNTRICNIDIFLTDNIYYLINSKPISPRNVNTDNTVGQLSRANVDTRLLI
ncbi:hypothetical protein BCR32DRAFT_284558 [Anaeromyces robustus]|uniref:Uncharacterized protein n=1 Tax=Anaeromyces robustus TaxID=1754192 RepID=A0A1Y1WRB5_9FUNG|nr:hypothetical protein BCR32DRAFT_284558 [Anaeromyces robustus]|eukprot:ORX76079.1 hypothetical protein BCR32DRAFT_284558 [Anaeromyces robustus]